MLREGAWCSIDAPTARSPAQLPTLTSTGLGVDEFSFVEFIDRLRHGVVVGVADCWAGPLESGYVEGSYAALVSVAEVSASKASGATRLHYECRRRVL